MASMLLVINQQTPDRWRSSSMPANALSRVDREGIDDGIRRGLGDGEIAEEIGRCRVTVNREVNRNGGRKKYSPHRAQRRADKLRKRPKTPILARDPELCAHVEQRLRAKDSPMRISIELARGEIYAGIEGRVSHETIYQGLYSGLIDPECRSHTHLSRKKRKHRGQPSLTASNRLTPYCSVHDRPQQAQDRSEIGHLEGDLIIGAYNRSAIITVADRLSRKIWLCEVPDKTADSIYHAMCGLLERIPPQHRKTLCWDQGSEIGRHRELAIEMGIEIYIADPHAPWQRPTNENNNAIVRRYVGKGTDLTKYQPKDLRYIEDRINTIPRRIHNWATANDIYNTHL